MRVPGPEVPSRRKFLAKRRTRTKKVPVFSPSNLFRTVLCSTAKTSQKLQKLQSQSLKPYMEYGAMALSLWEGSMMLHDAPCSASKHSVQVDPMPSDAVGS